MAFEPYEGRPVSGGVFSVMLVQPSCFAKAIVSSVRSLMLPTATRMVRASDDCRGNLYGGRRHAAVSQ
jgi:hypothetical protein